MKKTSVIALLLCVVFLLASFAGCSGGNGGSAETTATNAQTSASSSESASGSTAETTTAAPELKTLNGYEFTIVGELGNDYVEVAQNALQSKLLNAYAELEDKYDFTINFVKDVTFENVFNAALSNETIAEAIRFRHNNWGTLAVKKIILPLNTAEMKNAGLDVDDPEQVDYTFTQMSKVLDGTNVWVCSFSGLYNCNNFGHGIAFNKRLIEGAGYKTADIYQAVRDYKWNWELFEQICRDVSVDETGDGVNDIDGYSQMANECLELVTNGIGIVYKTSEGKWASAADQSQFITAVEWSMKLWNDKDITQEAGLDVGNGKRRDHFYEGKMAFMGLWNGNFGYSEGSANNKMADDYGFVPLPMGPNATTYAHYIPDLYGYSIMTNNKNWDKAAYALGLMGSVLNDPDEFETTISAFFRDDESLEMITEYMLPNAMPVPSRWCTAMREVVDEYGKLIFQSESAAAICEAFHQKLQVAINDMFGY